MKLEKNRWKNDWTIKKRLPRYFVFTLFGRRMARKNGIKSLLTYGFPGANPTTFYLQLCTTPAL
jgi:hypothetical protein